MIFYLISCNFKIDILDFSVFPIDINACCFGNIVGKTSCAVIMLHIYSSNHNMQKNTRKKKDKATEEDSYLEVFPKMEIIYEDTKVVTGAK